MLPKTIIHVVTYNETTVEPCLNSMLEQEGFEIGENFEIFVSYNKGLESTWQDLEKFKDKITLFNNNDNLGFAKGHNVGIEKALKAGAKYVLVANADLKLEKDFLKNLVTSLEADSSAGMATPKLYRANADLTPSLPKTFDATGMYFTTEIRHFDRASQEKDNNDYLKKQYVFGATGAAMLLKKSFIEDAKYQITDENGKEQTELELFDNSFFVYREDADLCWRAQSLGWNCIYEPSATAYHVRLVLPERREQLPREYNLNGVRNRFLMQISNLGFISALYCFKGFALRNLLVICACIIKERSSLNGLADVFRLFSNAWKKRKQNFSKRRRSELEVLSLFNKKHLPSLIESSEKELTGITAVIVNYNSGNRVNSCVESVLEAFKEVATKSNASTELVLIDNNSKEFNYENNKIKIIKSDHNLGFAGAINHVAKTYPNSAILIINPDINIDKACIINLFSSLKSYSNIGAIGANLINKDGSFQKGFTARKFPTLLSTCFEIIGLAKIFPKNFITSNYLLTDNRIFERYLSSNTKQGDLEKSPEQNSPIIADQPAGACLMIRKEAFDQIGGFEEDFYPAWFEDVDFCKRLNKNGWLCAVESKAKAIHEGGYSLNTMSRPEFFSIWYKNLIKYWKTHGSSLDRLIIRVFIKLGLGVRGILSLTKEKKEAKEYFKLLSRL